jgi:hypothetical protein
VAVWLWLWLWTGSAFAELHAQTYVENFYAKLGWKGVGPVYQEANIPHRTMHMNAPTASPAPAAADTQNSAGTAASDITSASTAASTSSPPSH